MSESLGAEEKTIKLIVRNLREAGLFTTGARGVNAPDIAPLDAARVIIAFLGSSSPSKAVKDVNYFGQLKPDVREPYADFTVGLGVSRDCNLEEALVRLMQNEVGYEYVGRTSLALSENGHAEIRQEGVSQEFHNREQWSAFNNSKGNLPEQVALRAKAIREMEVLRRIPETRVNRSAEIGLEIVVGIGCDLLGWSAD